MREALAVLAAWFMPWIAVAEDSAIKWGPDALQWVKSGTEAKAAIAKAQPAENAKVDWSRVVSLSPESVTVMTSTGLKSLPIRTVPEADQLKLGLTSEVKAKFAEWKNGAKTKSEELAILAELDRSQVDPEDERIPAKVFITQIISDTEALCRVIPRLKVPRRKPLERSSLGGVVGGGGNELVWRDGPAVTGWVIGNFQGRIDGEQLTGWVIPDGTHRYTTVIGSSRTIEKFQLTPLEADEEKR